jgi:hypothetical protein
VDRMKRSFRTPVCILVLLATSAARGESPSEKLGLGVWVCVVQQMAGIQSRTGRPPFVGKITPRHDRFIVRIERVTVEIPGHAIKPKYKATFQPRQFPFEPLYSTDSPLVLYGWGSDVFWLMAAKSIFVLHRSDQGNSYVAQGDCSRIK